MKWLETIKKKKKKISSIFWPLVNMNIGIVCFVGFGMVHETPGVIFSAIFAISSCLIVAGNIAEMLPDQPKEGDANARGDASQSKPTLYATSPGVTAGASTPSLAGGEAVNWIEIAQRGFENWKAKPHNARWFRKIDGTPIPNDLTICIGEAFSEAIRSLVAYKDKAERERDDGDYDRERANP